MPGNILVKLPFQSREITHLICSVVLKTCPKLENYMLLKRCILYYRILINRSPSSQCSTTGVTKDEVCAILSVGWYI